MILRIARHSVYVITSDSHTHSTDEETEFQRSEWLEKLNQDSSQEFFSLNPILLSLEQIYSPPPLPPSFPSKDGKQVICLLFSKGEVTFYITLEISSLLCFIKPIDYLWNAPESSPSKRGA